MTTLLWLRDDLRITDNSALTAACQDAEETGGGVIALWVNEHTEDDLGARPKGAATRWWYHRSLEELAPRLTELGVPLVFAHGNPREIVPKFAHLLEAHTVRWSRRYSPDARKLDTQVKEVLVSAGHQAHSHVGNVLIEPWVVAPAGREYYRVFTPFYNAASQIPVASPLPAPDRVGEWDSGSALKRLHGHTCGLDDLGLLDQDPEWWRDTVAEHWTPGEVAGRERLHEASHWCADYRNSRDRPGDEESTSRLSPYLRTGEVSVREALVMARRSEVLNEDALAWIRQLYWRDFCWHLTFHLPHLDREPMRAEFRRFPYSPDARVLQAWQQGRTGIDLVDAGMRELWHTGWMHNRVRMVTASLLTKNLLQPWWHGEQWFWDTLVDADEANNPVQWQWVAGCGADASPFFRVFNPDVQLRKFDPHGTYVNRWLPGLREVQPIVDLRESRAEALTAYDTIRN